MNRCLDQRYEYLEDTAPGMIFDHYYGELISEDDIEPGYNMEA